MSETFCRGCGEPSDYPHLTQCPIVEARLARGERGIPKIPDSPDTRHAQAQPALLHQVRLLGPHANSTSCVHCGTRLTGENLKDLCPARPAEQPAPPAEKLPAILNSEHPHWAEQPAPPQCMESYDVEGNENHESDATRYCQLREGHEGNHIDFTGYWPQPAPPSKEKMMDALDPRYGNKPVPDTLPASARFREEVHAPCLPGCEICARNRAAEPSVEARSVADKNDAREWLKYKTVIHYRVRHGKYIVLGEMTRERLEGLLTAYAAAVTQERDALRQQRDHYANLWRKNVHPEDEAEESQPK